jgi:hypothetical protein
MPATGVYASDAESAAERGLNIAREHKQRDIGWQDSQSNVTMIIRSANGSERVRKLALKVLEVQDDGDKSLMVFNEPRDVAGSAFLTYSRVNAPDDQWIYLPALKRVKRIASRNKSSSFMGSEFTYEDLSSFELEKYDFRFVSDETIAGQPCFLIEMIPLDPDSGYSRVVAWLDQEAYRFQKIDFYDRKQRLLKSLTMYDYQLLSDRYWRAGHSEMSNIQTGKVTKMLTENQRLGVGLDAADFSQNSLKRAR